MTAILVAILNACTSPLVPQSTDGTDGYSTSQHAGVGLGGSPSAASDSPTAASETANPLTSPDNGDGSVASSAAQPSNVVDKIQQMADPYRTRTGTPGVAMVLVSRDSESGGANYEYVNSGAPRLGAPQGVTEQTQFEIASQTKTFTAGLLAYLVSTGRVSLSDDLQKYAPQGTTVPSWTENGVTTHVTLGDLATHQAGLPDTPPNIDAGCPDAHPHCTNSVNLYTQDLMWQGLQQSMPLPWQPGTNWLYSNFGFALFGSILVGVLYPGQNPPAYQAALNDTFLTELNMSATFLERPTDQLASGYNTAGQPSQYYADSNAYAGEGGLISSTKDMGKWVAATLGMTGAGEKSGVLHDTLQPISAIATTCSDFDVARCSPSTMQMGMAWEIHPPTDFDNVGVRVARKEGATGGFDSATYMAPDLELGVTVLTNRDLYNPKTGSFPVDDLALESLKLLVSAQPQ